MIYYGREFREGNVHRTSWDSSHTYNLKRSLHMHKGEVGYTVKNYLGQDVLVTEPFDFGKTDGQIWRTCPKYRIRCERGYKLSPSGFGSISLPWKYTESKFADKFASTRCQIPPRCVLRDGSRRLHQSSRGRLLGQVSAKCYFTQQKLCGQCGGDNNCRMACNRRNAGRLARACGYRRQLRSIPSWTRA